MITFARIKEIIKLSLCAFLAVVVFGSGASAANPSSLRITGVPEIVHPGDTFQAVVIASGVSNLTCAQFDIWYHASVLEVLDSNPDEEGVNIASLVPSLFVRENEALDDGNNGADIIFSSLPRRLYRPET